MYIQNASYYASLVRKNNIFENENTFCKERIIFVFIYKLKFFSVFVENDERGQKGNYIQFLRTCLNIQCKSDKKAFVHRRYRK